MNIPIDLNNPSTLDFAIAELERFQFDRKCNEVCTRIAEVGRLALEAAYMGYVESDVSVTIEPTQNGCVLSASGSKLGFIEFGTGVSYPLSASAAEFGAPPHGTYGKGNGRKPSWTYIGTADTGGTVIASSKRGDVVRTSGNVAADGFTVAVDEMRSNFSRICEEVFGL